MTEPLTKGVHHVGLTVSSLEDSANFFTLLLGWREVRRNDAYPAIFVTDGKNMVTLWQAKEEAQTPFSRTKNIGLHHVAFQVESESELDTLHDTMKTNGIKIEFAPELLGEGPARHMMCYEPGGIRVEFIWPGQ